MIIKQLVLILLAFVVYCMMGYTEEFNIITLYDSTTRVSVTDNIMIASAKTEFTIRDILSPEQEVEFRLLESSNLKPGRESVWWLKFNVRNKTLTQNRFILEYNYFRANTKIELYLPLPDGNFFIKKEEPGMKNSARDIKHRNPIFVLDIPSGANKIFYIRLEIREPVFIDFSITSYKFFLISNRDDQMFIGFFSGVLFIMAFYNLFLFFAFRKKSFLFLIGFIINLLILQLNTFGILTENIVALQPFDNILGDLLMMSTTLFFILFGRCFISSKENLPSCWDRILILLTIINMVSGLLKVSFNGWALPWLISLFAAVLCLLTAVVRLLIKGQERAKYFFIITVTLIIFGITNVLRGYIPFLKPLFSFLPDPLSTGAILMIALFSFYLTGSINKLREKEMMAAKLMELDRVKSKFFANISHEFRTPLTLIMGPLEDMLDNSPDEEPRKKMEMMLSQSHHLLSLINQLLDLSMLDSSKMKLEASHQDIVSFVKGVTAGFDYIARQNRLFFEFEAKEKGLEIFFDREMMEKVILNLLINAVKFTPPGGRIFVSVTSGKESLKLFGNGYVEIIVADTGLGIEREYIGHIFDRFYHAKAVQHLSHAGTGIGLALVKELIQIHHGTIDVQSSTVADGGQGTRFTIRLHKGNRHLTPREITFSSSREYNFSLTIKSGELLAKNSGKKEDHRAEPEGISDDKERDIVIIIEDNPAVREYIREELEPVYDVREASNGTQGFEMAKKIIPSLIISDIVMPGIDGYKFCRKIKTEISTSHIPIILLTAKASEESRFIGFREGADDYITKPFNSRVLKARIKNLIDLRCQIQQTIQREMLLQPVNLVTESVEQEFLKRMQKVIEDNIANPEFSIENMADHLLLSRASLNRKIRALTGVSTNRFIQSYRLKRAAQLLKLNTGNVTEVAYAVGFSSSAYFTKCFKEKFHQLPSQFEVSET